MTEPGSPTNRDADSSQPAVPETSVPIADDAELNPAGEAVPVEPVVGSTSDPAGLASFAGNGEGAPSYSPPAFGEGAQWNAPENNFVPAPGYGIPPQAQQSGTSSYNPAQYGAPPTNMGYGQPAYQGAAAYPGYGVLPSSEVSPKTKVAGALLAFFLGGLGAHNFYFGKNGRAIAQLVTSLACIALLILSVVLLAAGVDSVETYRPYGGTIYEDNESLLAAGAGLMFLSMILLCGVALWAFIEFILVLVGSGGYDRDKEGRIIQ